MNDELNCVRKLVEAFPDIIRRSSGLGMFIGFHSLENKIITEGLRSAVESENKRRGISGASAPNYAKTVKLVDRGERPGKEELADNPASKSAELHSIIYGLPQTGVPKKGAESLSLPRAGWLGASPRGINNKSV